MKYYKWLEGIEAIHQRTKQKKIHIHTPHQPNKLHTSFISVLFH